MRLLITLLLICQVANSYAQKDTLTTDVDWPIGLAIHNNILFIAEAVGNQISTLDLNIPNSSPQTFITGGLDRPNFMKIVGDYLYFAEYGGRISKVDLTQTNPSPVTILSGLLSPKSILIYNSDLYYTRYNQISKIDLTESNPIPTIVLDGLDGVINLAMEGQNLYFSEYTGGRISKIDLTASNPQPITILSDLDGPLGGMTINNNELYFYEHGDTTISVVNINSQDSIPTIFDTGVISGDIYINGNDIYISDFKNDLILRYTNVISSINEPIEQSFIIFPNPTRDFIEIKGNDNPLNYSITTSTGKIITNFNKLNENRIDISLLPSGMYVLTFDNGETYKIIKL